MKKLYILSITAAVLTLTAVIFSVKNPDQDAPENNNTATQEENYVTSEYKANAKPQAEESNFKPYYTVKSTDGEIYVYNSDNEIVKKLDIDYNSLREYDKEQFQKGIVIEDIEDVYHIAEDFSE